MKIYVAASYPRKKDAIAISDRLEALGHTMMSRWKWEDEGYTSDFGRRETQQEQYDRLSAAAIRDLEDLKNSEIVVCLTDGENQLTHGGRHSELGIMLYETKRVIIIGPREQVFHYHPDVKQYESVEDFFYWKDFKNECF